MGKIKICHLIDNSTFNLLLFNSIKHSDRKKFEYFVVSLEKPGILQQQMAALGVKSFSLNYSSKKQFFSKVLELYNFFRREKIQIVQTHLLISSLIGLTAAKLARVPVTIFTGHHSAELVTYNRKLLTFIDGLNGRMLSDYSIAPSEFMKSVFVDSEKIPASKVRVIPHGFDLKEWREKAGAANDLNEKYRIENKTIIGAVGRLVKVKNFENLIRAFEKISPRYKDTVLMIAGDGDQTNLRKLIEENNLTEKVFLTGKRNDIASVINRFDILVHASHTESFGMILVEALALGKPVVATKVGVAENIIQNGVNGFLIDNFDVEALAAGMSKILDRKPLWRQMGEAGKITAKDFAVETTQKQCDEFYLETLNK